MKVLITSGGTTENIDRVRGITNFATGSLGKIIAEKYIENGHFVILLAGRNAKLPDPSDKLKIVSISDTQSLDENMAKYVPQVDIVIHSMAVSDYSPIYMTDFNEVATSDNLNEFLNMKNSSKKISSKSDYQVLFLKKNPKIISKIKEYNQHIILIGFKLLVGVPKGELFSVARTSLKKNKADYIFANDLEDIFDGQHIGYLVDENGEKIAHTKSEIADLIFTTTLQKMKGEING